MIHSFTDTIIALTIITIIMFNSSSITPMITTVLPLLLLLLFGEAYAMPALRGAAAFCEHWYANYNIVWLVIV